MRRFQAPALPAQGGPVLLEPEASHHLLRVTGIAPGEAVILFDAAGLEARARLEGAQGGRALLYAEAARPAAGLPERWLLASLVKHEAFDLLVRMATELGATRILPVLAARSVARGDRADRWRRIAASAAAQCGRAALPAIADPIGLAEALARVPEGHERRIYAAEGERLPPPGPPCSLLLGPEGGFTTGELILACDAGFRSESLGGLALRADTAAAAALARTLPVSG